MSGHRVGESPPRPDGRAKATGAEIYGDDFVLPGMLWGAVLRSPVAHGRIESVEQASGDDLVWVGVDDLPGPNGVQLLDDSWPILAREVVRHVGEPVALVAAPSRERAAAAVVGSRVRVRALPAVLDLEEATELLAEAAVEKGDVEGALAAASSVVDGTYRTGHQEHIYIECQVMTAWFEGPTLHVVGSMQCPYYVHKSLAHALGMSADHVRVRAPAVGGGFGGKEDFPSLLALHAALLARAAGRPVRILYDRHEDIIATTKRHPSIVRCRHGFDGDGRLLAIDVDLRLDGGAYRTLSPVVLSRAVLHATGPYRCPAVRIRGRALATNTAPNGAFRGFGAPQAQFAAERQMDRIAAALGLDPFEIRRRNVVGAGDRLATGQCLDDAAALDCLDRVVEKTDFVARWRELSGRASGEERSRGLGLSLFFHGAGFTGNGERRMRSPVTVRLTDEGRVAVLTAMTDMGQGCAVVFPQIAATAGGLSPDDLEFPPPDTGLVPDSGPTVASRTTMVVGGTIAIAMSDLRDRVGHWWATERGYDDWSITDGICEGPGGERESFRSVARSFLAAEGALEITRRHEPPPEQQFDETTYRGSAYPTYSWGAAVVEVEVDADTLAVAPIEVTTVCEVGRAIHPVACRGQVEGGTLQAIGFALWEEMKMEEGRYANDRLQTYIIPTILDAPRFEVELLERPYAGGPFGAKGVGELPMDGAASAVSAAIECATGLSVQRIPTTPEHLFALGEEAS